MVVPKFATLFAMFFRSSRRRPGPTFQRLGGGSVGPACAGMTTLTNGFLVQGTTVSNSRSHRAWPTAARPVIQPERSKGAEAPLPAHTVSEALLAAGLWSGHPLRLG